MDITRRTLLEIAALALGAPAVPRADGQSPLQDAEHRAADAIRSYSAEGFHRTGTSVDRESADRLAALARSAGADATLEAFELSRVDPVACYVEINDSERIEGLPMFDGPFTPPNGVGRAIGPLDTERPIALLQTAPNGEAPLRTVRLASRHRAIVVATLGGRPGLCPVNAAWFTEPFGPPVIQVSGESLPRLQTAAAGGDKVHVVSHVSRQHATAMNVVAAFDGSSAGLSPVCVMTPRSGWHANAAERGGGLACWLEAIRAVANERHDRAVLFVASSGHELGHLGLHSYLDRRPGLAATAFAWVHLGANIGASTGATRMTPSDDRLADAAVRALTPYRLGTIARGPVAQVAGEAATIREQNGRFVSFIGQNAWFHNPRDLWPDTVDIAAVARFARGIADLTLALARTPS